MYQICIGNNKGLVIPSIKTISFVKALSIVCLNNNMNVRVFDLNEINSKPVFIHRGAK